MRSELELRSVEHCGPHGQFENCKEEERRDEYQAMGDRSHAVDMRDDCIFSQPVGLWSGNVRRERTRRPDPLVDG